MNYTIKINDFEGPFDLLLHLIKQNNLNINDLKIDIITKQYLNYIEQMENLNLTIASEYLVMAAELIELKSKSLLPIEKNDELDEYVEDPKDKLIKNLIEYEKYKNITNTFKDLENERNLLFTKSPENLKNYQIDEVIKDDDLKITDLLTAFSNFIEKQKLKEPLTTKITSKEISIKERTNYIKEQLKINKTITFNELFDIIRKDYIIATFLAILEMVKNNEISIEQKHNFDNITISLRRSSNE